MFSLSKYDKTKNSIPMNLKAPFLTPKRRLLLFLTLLCMLPAVVQGEDGHRLWLRYDQLPDTLAASYRRCLSELWVRGESPQINVAAEEIRRAVAGMTGREPALTDHPFRGKVVSRTPRGLVKPLTAPGLLVIGKAGHPDIAPLLSVGATASCGEEGFLIRTLLLQGRPVILVTGNSDAGVLYGVFALIRRMQTGDALAGLDLLEQPAYQRRLLNHWDNLDGTVERGYAGHSLWWNTSENPEILADRYRDYARANASVGINGTVLNNVNASPEVLKPEYIARFAAVADLLRPYNIRVYMSVNFSSPAILGGLPDSDPLKSEVVAWWKEKVKEIYTAIPDFGGFLVKANSEGQPGPQNYGRTHAEGANMLAGALKPYNGVVMWRAFVYNPTSEDRHRQAYNEFMPLDGKFADNVIVQVKNGPIDFQPREPFSPLFGAMQKTPLMVEFQITQEYLGFSDHLVYLAPLQKECLDSDTWSKGAGSTVARATDGSLFPHRLTAIAGVANIGRDTNWCGHHFAQANWYAFGRLAWNHQLSPELIGREWLAMTFSPSSSFTEPALQIMMRSREAAVKYMTPMGLHHLMGWSHHYGPEPWTDLPNARLDWLPRYYHNASANGIGFDRSPSGSNAVEQYGSPLRELYSHPTTCPQNLLLWFHHLPWDYTLSSGKNLWDELCYNYYAGVEEVRYFQKIWNQLKGQTDPERFAAIQKKLKIQCREAVWWRDACLLYFQTFSQREIPAELERPVHDLDELMQLKFNLTHHN